MRGVTPDGPDNYAIFLPVSFIYPVAECTQKVTTDAAYSMAKY